SGNTIAIPMSSLAGVHDLYLTFRNPSIVSTQPVCMVEWMAFRPRLAGEEDPLYSRKVSDFIQLLNHKPPSVPIMVENPSHMTRTTHVFERGNWLVHGDAVTPEVPR